MRLVDVRAKSQSPVKQRADSSCEDVPHSSRMAGDQRLEESSLQLPGCQWRGGGGLPETGCQASCRST